jgi:hypothetical protein
MADDGGHLPTLGYLLDTRLDLQVWCNTCRGFGPLLRAEDLVEQFGRDLAVLELDKRLRCSRCGEAIRCRRVEVRQKGSRNHRDDDRRRYTGEHGLHASSLMKGPAPGIGTRG